MTDQLVVLLYSKPGCHLCDEAEVLVSAVAREEPLSVQRVNIEDSAELFAEFRYRIPVIQVRGGPSLDWPTTAERIRRAVRAARQSAS